MLSHDKMRKWLENGVELLDRRWYLGPCTVGDERRGYLARNFEEMRDELEGYPGHQELKQYLLNGEEMLWGKYIVSGYLRTTDESFPREGAIFVDPKTSRAMFIILEKWGMRDPDPGFLEGPGVILKKADEIHFGTLNEQGDTLDFVPEIGVVRNRSGNYEIV